MLLQVREAAVEGWGSLIHALHDDVARASPGRIVCRLFIREAGLKCEGSARDEIMVRELVRVLSEAHRLSALRRSRRRHEPPSRPRDADEDNSFMQELFEGLPLDRNGMAQEARDRAEPRTLDNDDVKLLRGHMHGGNFEDSDLVPLSRWVPHGPGPAAAAVATGEMYGSLLREKLADWLRSKQGEDWAAERKRLFRSTGTAAAFSSSSSSSSSTSG